MGKHRTSEGDNKRMDIVRFIARTITDTDRPPTTREIGVACDILSTSNVHHHIKILIEEGILKKMWGARGVVLADDVNMQDYL